MNDSFKTFLAFLGGAAAGAAIGILLAPDKGSETRRKIVSRAKDLTDGLSDAAKDKYNELLNWKDSMMNDAETEIRNTVNKVVDKADNKVKNAHV